MSNDALPHVLIIDDEVELTESIARGLKSHFNVIARHSGDDGIEAIQTETIDCVLLDVRMPGKDGIEVLKEIHQMNPHLPVILMTGHGDEEVTLQALRGGAFSYMQKPLDLYAVITEIKHAINFGRKKSATEQSTTCLLVDNDPDYLNKLKDELKEYPYHVDMVNSAEETISYLSQNSVDILIINISHPELEDLTLIKEAKKQQPDISPILITKVYRQDTIIQAIKLGCFDCLKKEDDPHALVSSIDRAAQQLTYTKELHQKNKMLLDQKTLLENLNDRVNNQKRHMENIIQSISNYIAITDLNGSIKICNDAMAKALDYPQDELQTMRLENIILDEDVETLYQNVISNDITHSSEKKYMTNHGTAIDVIFSCNVMKDEHGKPVEMLCVAQDITERKKFENELKRLARYDSLTELPNRLHYEIVLEKALHSKRKNKEMFALLYLDLDGFKAVNDRLGHFIGDLLLREVANRLQQSIRRGDFVARIGGDEFAIILDHVENANIAANVSYKLIKALNIPYQLKGNEVIVGASIGIAIYPEAGEDVDTLAQNADIALYQAKNSGRNQYKLYTEALNAEHRKRLHIENELRFALTRDQFYLAFQPIFDLNTDKASSVEALLRWKHHELGNISPAEFIPIAEEIGLIQSIGDWVIKRACHIFKEQFLTKDPDMTLAINLSTHQLKQLDFIQHLQQTFAALKIAPHSITFELTETAVMTNPKASEETLEHLHKMGFEIAIDDFGTGYSSFSYIRKLPVSILKIDKTFIDDIDSEDNQAIVKSIVALANVLNLKVVAEGIETKKQLDFIRNTGCRFAQGHYLQKDQEVNLKTNLNNTYFEGKAQSKTKE